MWNSVSILNGIAFWGLWVAAISGGVAAVSALAGGLAASRASEIATREANTKIAESNARAEEARETAAKANARAEEANAEARRLQTRLHKAQEMRSLTKPQAEALMPLFKSNWFQKEPRPVIAVLHVPDAEAQSLAYQFVDFIKSCGVECRGPFEAFQKVPNDTDMALGISTREPTMENQPFARLQRSLQLVGFSVGTIIEPIPARQASLYVLRKPQV